MFDLVYKDSRKFGRKIFGKLKFISSLIECPMLLNINGWVIMHRMTLIYDQYNGKPKPYKTGDHLSFARNNVLYVQMH